jgi:hypothetical protein
LSSKQESTYNTDTTKPDGDACREDGTLKDVCEMEWVHSPSDEYNHSLATQHEGCSSEKRSELEYRDSPFEHNHSLITQDELGWPNLSPEYNSSELSGKRKRRHLESKESESDAEQAPKTKVSSDFFFSFVLFLLGPILWRAKEPQTDC